MSERTLRGVDHVGITVSDIESATAFFVDALGGEVLYQGHGPDDPAVEGEDFEIAPRPRAGNPDDSSPGDQDRDRAGHRVVRDARPRAGRAGAPSDLGLTHLAFYTDDMEAAVERFERAGGWCCRHPPRSALHPRPARATDTATAGTPWGMSIEFLTLPGEMGYEQTTNLRRWQRQP